jgi:hypothetical protein
MNAPVERPHQTVADGIRTLLGGANLELRYWTYAFYHYLKIYNLVPHGDDDVSPYEKCTGIRPDLSKMRTFGCLVTILDDNKRKTGKANYLSRHGIFLGFTDTFKQIHYEDETGHIKTASHVVFDEAENNRTPKERSPNAQLLFNATARDVEGLEADNLRLDEAMPDFKIVDNPWDNLKTIKVDLKWDYDEADNRPLGFSIQDCQYMHRPFIVADKNRRKPDALLHHPKGYTRDSFIKLIKGAYILKVNDVPTTRVEDIENMIYKWQDMSDEERPTQVTLEISGLRKAPKAERAAQSNLRISDSAIRRIYMINSIDPSGMTRTEYLEALDKPPSIHIPLDRLGKSPSPEDFREFYDIKRLEVPGMTDEERLLTKFTRSRLKKLSNWDTWDQCFDHEWDRHTATGLVGDPVPRPHHQPGSHVNIFRVVWNNHIKPEGTRKARACLDGSKRAAPWLREQVNTYSSCLEQPAMRLFFALCAQENYIVTYGDSTNAFQNAPPPTHQCYLEIDESYQVWYKRKTGKDIDPKTHVIPLNRAMQGHPESGRLWATMVNSVLIDELGLIPSTHEPNLYRGIIDGKQVLVARMVDDYAIGSADETAAQKICDTINQKAVTEHLGIGTLSPNGAFARFNGVDVYQTRHYNKICVTTYIERLLLTHGWAVPAEDESDRHDIIPMSYDKATQLLTLEGPKEGTQEHRDLEQQVGFSYRQVLGELMYAFVVCRLDIGYAVTLLSRISSCPHREHYTALLKIAKYLRATKDWGLIYWRSIPNDAFPDVPLPEVPIDPSLPSFPEIPLDDLASFVDAAHAADPKTRRSVTGFTVMLAGAAIAFKTKLQKVVTTSSTEAELVAAVAAAKVVRYLRSVLTDLGYPPSGPTILHEDNQAVLDIVNKEVPSERTRHVDIQYFALQDWRARGLIKMAYVPGVINPADQATKAVGSTLHYRHVRRSMGHHRPSHVPQPTN